MALSGLHVAASRLGIVGPFESAKRDERDGPLFPLASSPLWSETLASAGTTTLVVPPESIEQGKTILTVRAGVEAWIAIGPNPNALANPRRIVAANEDCAFIVNAGDRLAWRPT